MTSTGDLSSLTFLHLVAPQPQPCSPQAGSENPLYKPQTDHRASSAVENTLSLSAVCLQREIRYVFHSEAKTKSLLI